MSKSVRIGQAGVTTTATIVGNGGGDSVLIKNLGPRVVLVGQGDTISGASLSEANSYPLPVGKSISVPDYDIASSDNKRVFVATISGSSQIVTIGYVAV